MQSSSQPCIQQKMQPGAFGAEPQAPQYLRLWILRILQDLKGYREFISDGDGFRDREVADALGLGEWDEAGGRTDADAKMVNHRNLAQLYGEQIDQLDPVMNHEVLSINIQRIAKVTGMSEAECHILGFIILLHAETVLASATDYLGAISRAGCYHAISVILKIPVKEVRASLSAHSKLVRSGLVRVNSYGIDRMQRKLETISDRFVDMAVSEVMQPVDMMRGLVIPAGNTELRREDYRHLQAQLAILLPYLKKAMRDGRKGVNILLYGEPGTGKTEFTRVVADACKAKLHSVASEDEDGDLVKGSYRINFYRAAQSMMSNRNMLLVFDEVEDIFRDDGGRELGIGVNRTERIGKAAMNRLLEENMIPTFWISNSVHDIDAAYIRRFDIVIEMTVPPRAQRRHIIEKAFDGLLPEESIEKFAASEKSAPAIITRVASVLENIAEEIPSETLAASAGMMIKSTLKAQGNKPDIEDALMHDIVEYSTAYINSDLDCDAVLGGLRNSRRGRLCLYGPPGTGKTAYAGWLANKLSMPIQIKRASDLQSPYLGVAEKNIAEAFERAGQDETILVIDEVDSFLQDRHHAVRSWEHSQVNEFLTQMESFEGIFIASTNLMDNLDRAAMRRFDMKIRFDYMRPEQTWQMLVNCCAKLGLGMGGESWQNSKRIPDNLTPGDFSAVMRANRLSPIKNVEDFIVRLEKECEWKEPKSNNIGFLAEPEK